MSSIYRKINYRAAEGYTPPEPSGTNTSAPGNNNDLGRKYVEDKKNDINKEFDKLVGNVDNLLKAVKELHVNGAVRGLQPLLRKLQTVSKDLALADVKLKKMKEVVNDELPIWNNTWDNEIERVRDDRVYVRVYKELVDELQEDITKAYCTVTLVKYLPKVQKKISSKSNSRGMSRE